MVLTSITRTDVTRSRLAQRERLLAVRASWPAADRTIAARAIADSLHRRLADFTAPTVIGVYWAIRAEPELPKVEARQYWGLHTLALPRVRARGEPLEFGLWRPSASISRDRSDIGTPDPFEPIEPQLLIIPCVGFDRRGYRLGYGGGFYDRTLAARNVPTIGVAFDRCELDDFEPLAHDQPLDMIVTESRVIRTAGQG